LQAAGTPKSLGYGERKGTRKKKSRAKILVLIGVVRNPIM